MKHARIGLLVLLSALSTIIGFAQGSPEYGSGLKLNLNSEGNKFVRFIFWNQIWAKSVKNNPGTLVSSEQADRSFDIGARRIRTIIHAQISPRYLIMTHFGVNNQIFNSSKKPQIFFHDVYNEYAIVPTKNPVTGKVNKSSLYAGAGLHYWNGISRITAASTLNFLMIDAPVFNWPTLEVSDQLIRQFGVYAKGNVGKLHYSFNVNKPFATATTPIAGGPAVDNNGNSKAAIGGYADYQFFDQEAQVLPFRVGSYLGTKKVLNVGAGFFNNKEGTQSMTTSRTLNKHDINIYAVDVFTDLPFGPQEKNMALTAYSVLYDYNYGPNYLRTIGIMNTGTVDTSFKGPKAQEGAGNARFMLGTGKIWYTQAGLLLPKTISKKLRIQPIASYTLKNLQALSEKGHYYDFGSNIFIDGHNSKITIQYSSHPLYNNNKVFKRVGEWLIQFQVYL